MMTISTVTASNYLGLVRIGRTADPTWARIFMSESDFSQTYTKPSRVWPRVWCESDRKSDLAVWFALKTGVWSVWWSVWRSVWPLTYLQSSIVVNRDLVNLVWLLLTIKLWSDHVPDGSMADLTFCAVFMISTSALSTDFWIRSETQNSNLSDEVRWGLLLFWKVHVCIHVCMCCVFVCVWLPPLRQGFFLVWVVLLSEVFLPKMQHELNVSYDKRKRNSKPPLFSEVHYRVLSALPLVSVPFLVLQLQVGV